MNILALDTSTHVGSVSLTIDGKLACELAVRVRASHGESILPWIDLALRSARLRTEQLDLVAYSKGPGSFTGVRIGLATAKGLALATGVPLLGISSLRALAHQLELCSALVCPVIDARKHEIYTCAMRFTPLAGGQNVVGVAAPVVELPECVCSPEEAAARLRAVAGSRELVLVGEGVAAYREEILRAIGEPSLIAPPMFDVQRGALLAELARRDFEAGLREDPALAAPSYLRPPEAEYKARA